MPQHHIREADAMWSTRIWREIDLRQKINQPLYYPLESSQGYSSLYGVLSEGIAQGNLTAYGIGPLGMDDEMTQALTIEEVRALTHTVDTIWTPMLDGSGHIPVPSVDSVSSAEITRYRIKEDWVFDRNVSRMVVRIIGIAPLKESFAPDGSSRGFTPLYWIDFKEARPLLAQAPVYLRHNNNQQLNYDDVFMKRFFDATVVKSSNVYDRNIQSYTSGIDALLEAERIEQRIHTWEQDLWSH